MRLFFHSVDGAKMMAKRLASSTGQPLSKCQNMFAKAAGYRDWFDLNQNCAVGWDASWENDLGNDQLATLIIGLAELLEAEVGDVQFALTQTGIMQGGRQSLEQQLALRAILFRNTSIPDLGDRQPGAVGKCKYDHLAMILRSFGGLTRVIRDRCVDTGVAEFEFVTPRASIPLFIPTALYLAYGSWTERDGSTVIHSRDYLPLWRLRSGHNPERLNPADWIEHDDHYDSWFWQDHNAPWENAKRIAEEQKRLQSFGIYGLPKLVEILPDLIFHPGHTNCRGAAKARFGETSNSSHVGIDAA